MPWRWQNRLSRDGRDAANTGPSPCNPKMRTVLPVNWVDRGLRDDQSSEKMFGNANPNETTKMMLLPTYTNCCSIFMSLNLIVVSTVATLLCAVLSASDIFHILRLI